MSLRITTCLALAILGSLSLGEVPLRAQQRLEGFRQILPNVPVAPVRPLEGSTPEEQFRVPEGRRPVAGMVEGLSRTDATIEIIAGQSRILTLKDAISSEMNDAVVGIGQPTVLDFQVLPNPRMFRLLGRVPGVTDLTITTSSDEIYSFEVHVVYDLQLLTAKMRQLFPEAQIRLSQIRENLIVEGQGRSTEQIQQIVSVLEAYIQSLPSQSTSGQSNQGSDEEQYPDAPRDQQGENGQAPPRQYAGGQEGGDIQANVTISPRVINLMTVPGVQQVMLQVKIAELNRTALREIGADVLFQGSDASVGTQIAGATASLLGLVPSQSTTAYAVFPTASFDIMLRALRRNAVLNVMAEPNLVAMSGQNASFLAGGEYPVPVVQGGGGGGGGAGGGNAVTIEFKTFGVQLNFTPVILDDETIRLQVAPEASTIDESIGVELQGFAIPGVSTRRLSTTVELKQGQTLALAGLLLTERDGQTSRIPLVGDLPYIGPLFGNTSHRKSERELLVMVTPHLVQPMSPAQVGPMPGSEIQDPNDLEFYLMSRIEGRTGRPHRPTTSWDNPLGLVEYMKLEQKNVCGPIGFSESQ